MRSLRNFEEFLESGTVKRRSSDRARAKSLIEEAESRLRFLNELIQKIPVSDENANYFVESVYDVLISLIRARLLIDGFNSSGEGSHEAEVAYMRRMGSRKKTQGL